MLSSAVGTDRAFTYVMSRCCWLVLLSLLPFRLPLSNVGLFLLVAIHALACPISERFRRSDATPPISLQSSSRSAMRQLERKGQGAAQEKRAWQGLQLRWPLDGSECKHRAGKRWAARGRETKRPAILRMTLEAVRCVFRVVLLASIRRRVLHERQGRGNRRLRAANNTSTNSKKERDATKKRKSAREDGSTESPLCRAARFASRLAFDTHPDRPHRTRPLTLPPRLDPRRPVRRRVFLQSPRATSPRPGDRAKRPRPRGARRRPMRTDVRRPEEAKAPRRTLHPARGPRRASPCLLPAPSPHLPRATSRCARLPQVPSPLGQSWSRPAARTAVVRAVQRASRAPAHATRGVAQSSQSPPRTRSATDRASACSSRGTRRKECGGQTKDRT